MTGKWHRQFAVVWEFAAFDAVGEATVYEPEVKQVRWENVTNSLVRPDGTVVDISVEMHAEELVPIHSIVYKSTDEEIPGTATDLFQVVDYDEIPDVKGKIFDRVMYLKRFSDTLPMVVTS